MYNLPIIDNIETGKRIEQLRKENHYTVKELQKIFCFSSPQAIYKWQWGETLPDIQNLLTLAQLFDCKVEDILVYD